MVIKRTILVTGNTGYIGPVMTRLLKKESFRVIGLDSGWFKDSLFFPVPALDAPEGQILKDIRYVNESDLEGIDAVIHLAGLSNDPLGELNTKLTNEINYESTIKLAGMCRAKGIKRFIFASSCSIYGISDSGEPINETGVINPMTAYAKAKIDSEKGLARLAGGDFQPVFMRNATVYGLSPRLRLDLVVNNLLAWAYLTGEAAIMSDGTPWRPIVHIEDFCRAAIAALKAPGDKVSCQAFNVGRNEENYRVKDIAEAVSNALPGSKISILNKTGPDERSYRVDFSKIKKMLPEFRPQWDVKKGINELINGYRRYGLRREDFEGGRYFRIKTVKSMMESGDMSNDLLLKRRNNL